MHNTLDWKTTKLWKWIQENPPQWAHQRIRHLSEDYSDHLDNDPTLPSLKDFVFLAEHANQDVEPETIVGQWEHYAGQTWFEAVTNPQWKEGKMRNCLVLADSNPEYYLQDLKDIQITSYDGKHWYSHTGGNHRTIVGKFLLAMLTSANGKKYRLRNVSTLRYYVDHECLQTFKRLKKFILEIGVAIGIDACSEPFKSNDRNSTQSKIRIKVTDYRWGNRLERFGWLSSAEFQKFADWIIKTDGKLSYFLKIKDFMGIIPRGREHRLYYPDMSDDFLESPSTLLLSKMAHRRAHKI